MINLNPELINVYGELAGDEVFIVNKFFKARGFRKIHLEIAQLGSSLEILHSVFFPEPSYDLPIFGVDIVSTIDGISAAIVDLSPVNKSLPSSIDKKLSSLDIPKFTNKRPLPNWGTIFSPYVQFIKPHDFDESTLFFNTVDDFINILISHSDSIEPNSDQSPITIERYKHQRNYCQQQKCNDKTRGVLSKIFGPKWADQYIDMVLFDCPDQF